MKREENMPLLKKALSATNYHPRDLKRENRLKTGRAVVDWAGERLWGTVDRRLLIPRHLKTRHSC